MLSPQHPFSCQAGPKAATVDSTTLLFKFVNHQAVIDNLIFLMDQHGSPHQPVSSIFLMDASLAPLQRRFERLDDALHERLPFSTPKTAHSLSTVFDGSRYDLRDQQKVVVESEPNREKSCTDERLYDDIHESVTAYLVGCGVVGQNVGLRGLTNAQGPQFVSIPDGVE